MKKLLSIAVASFAVEAMAVVTSVPTSPTIGVTQINTTNKNTVIAVPFESLDGCGEIVARDLVSTNGLPDSTCLYIFNGTSYSGWTLIPGQGWTPASSASAAISMPAITTPDTTQALDKGSAIFVALPAAPASGGQNISIYGKLDDTLTGTTVVAGNNLVANPLQSAATFSIDSPVSGDEIVIPQDGVNARYIYRVPRTGSPAWRKDNASVELPQIPIGTGFWYIRTADADSATITWSAVQ